MPSEFVTGSPILEAAWAVGTIVVFSIAAAGVVLGMRRVASKWEKRLKATPISQLLQGLANPVMLLVLAQGFFLALGSLSALDARTADLANASVAVVIVLVTVSLTRIGSILLRWYTSKVSKARRRMLDASVVPLLRRTLISAIYTTGALVLLDHLGISIAPMLAGLGIGGLAVALALQPTLGNFFAGTQIISDSMVKSGDYVELEGSIRGYVLGVGWRSTRIRTPFNNLLIIPNSRLADSIITNYQDPSTEMAVIVECGVSYSSDLAHVERVALEVATKVLKELPEGMESITPWIGFSDFGDSNIGFWVWVYARDRVASFVVKSALVKQLHARFRDEGIEINYPIRKLMYEEVDGAQSPPLQPSTAIKRRTKAIKQPPVRNDDVEESEGPDI